VVNVIECRQLKRVKLIKRTVSDFGKDYECSMRMTYDMSKHAGAVSVF
jgi:hypothetical protein